VAVTCEQTPGKSKSSRSGFSFILCVLFLSFCSARVCRGEKFIFSCQPTQSTLNPKPYTHTRTHTRCGKGRVPWVRWFDTHPYAALSFFFFTFPATLHTLKAVVNRWFRLSMAATCEQTPGTSHQLSLSLSLGPHALDLPRLIRARCTHVRIECYFCF
jgi:hypothetical protein